MPVIIRVRTPQFEVLPDESEYESDDAPDPQITHGDIIESLRVELIERPQRHEKCAVCHENYTVQPFVKVLQCGHAYHTRCIDTWLMSNLSCPLCRGDVRCRE